uniref:Protein yippee-like n=1 Tax=Pinguiococcus pyrenoidosus TaxID=172671 RepID=A0A7R9UCL1_9STRA|eukprot:scaffold7358_cov252-Pinguiococcus_pyrenoidosus.AAC.26
MGDGVDAPLVFQCRRCERIIGDSWALVETSEVEHTLTLSGVSDKVRRRGQKLCCANCNSVLGRDAAIGCVLDVDKIQSYALGSSGMAAAAPAAAEQGAAENDGDLAKIKNVLLHFHERLCSLEDAGLMDRLASLERRL